MTATDKACQRQQSPLLEDTLRRDIERQEHFLVCASIGSREWKEALSNITRLYAQMAGE